MHRAALFVVLVSLAVGPLPSPAAAAPVAPPADVCAPACTVLAVDNEFVPRATVVVSGSTVTWEAPDVNRRGHSATALGSFCMNLGLSQGRSAEAQFRVEEGVLYATTAQLGEVACTDAVGVGGGIMLLRYVCLPHASNGMEAHLLVVPA